jgi:hypothetical protein
MAEMSWLALGVRGTKTATDKALPNKTAPNDFNLLLQNPQERLISVDVSQQLS